MFVGQRDDPFFIDLGVTFDLINFRDATTGNAGGYKDDVAGYSVHSFVLKLPERAITRDGKAVGSASSANAAVGVWATTERRRLEVSDGRDRGGSGPYVQVNRLGNPLINELFIPISRKDEFNRSQPRNDGAAFGQYALEPELVKAINALFNLGCKETNRTDIVQALFTGIPGLTQIGNNPAAADTLKLNLGVAPTAAGQVNRFGVIGGDVAGLPNGRRLAGRRGGHLPARGMRLPRAAQPRREEAAARRRRRSQRQGVPLAVPVRGRSHVGLRLEDQEGPAAARTHPGFAAAGALSARPGDRSAVPRPLRSR